VKRVLADANDWCLGRQRPDSVSIGKHWLPAGGQQEAAHMYLTPTEEDRLVIFTAAQLARRALADGARLNAPEATALICDEMHRAARIGASADGVLAAGRAAVRREDLMDGVDALLSEIRLEVLLGDGTRLVVLRDAWRES